MTKPEQRYMVSSYNQYLVEQGYEPDRVRDGVGVFSSNRHYELPEEHQMGAYLGDQAAEFIEENKDRPFVLYVSTFEPHSPYHGPYMDMYDPETLPRGACVPTEAGDGFAGEPCAGRITS